MKDAYYFKSLITTLLLYCTVMTGIVYTVYSTGMIGFMVLLSIIAGLLGYFYGAFEKSSKRGKRNN